MNNLAHDEHKHHDNGDSQQQAFDAIHDRLQDANTIRASRTIMAHQMKPTTYPR